MSPKILRLLRTILIAIVIALAFRAFLFASYIVDGKSMEPTLYDGNLLMVNKVVYSISEIDRFDVIVFRANETEDYVKRVIGLPGDTITYDGDTLILNGKKVEEPFLAPFRANNREVLTDDFTLFQRTGKQQVPPGHIFVLGDNRQKSFDSRYFGFVPITDIVGKVDVKYWPIKQLAIQL